MSPALWKKWSCLADLADRAELMQFSHALLMDAETLVVSCARLREMAALIARDESTGKWPTSDSNRWQAPKTSASVHAAAMQAATSAEELKQLTSATRRYVSYPWWTQLPYVRTTHILALFEQWARRPTLWPHARNEAPKTSGNASAPAMWTPSPMSAGTSNASIVADYQPGRRLGVGGFEAFAFEHLVVVLWRVLHDVPPLQLESHHASSVEAWRGSLLENAAHLPLDELQLLQPLWLPSAAYRQLERRRETAAAVRTLPVVFTFHTDRV